MRTQQKIYNDLLKTYQRTHKIGNAKPYNIEHAKKIAWAASTRIYNKQWEQKVPTTALSAPKGRSPWSPVGCCQLELFSTKQYQLN